MLLTEALATVVPTIDPALVSSATGARIVEMARAGSQEAVAAYIECRTAPEADRTDLLLCMVATNDPRPPKRPAQTRGPSGEGWSLAEAVQLCRRTPGGVLHRGSPLIWLEFDDAGRSCASAVPSVCVCMQPGYLTRDRYGDSSADCAAMVTTIAALADVEAANLSTVLRCLRALPAAGRAIHLSVMCSREGKATKLYARLPLARVTDYLDEIGWGGDRAPLLNLLAWLGPIHPFVHLDISVENGSVAARLGIAFPRADDGERFDLGLFDGLAARALSSDTAERIREAGKAWVRTEPTVTEPGGWAHIVHRWIDQKIVLDGDPPELKLYLAVRPIPFLFGALDTAERRQ